MEEAHSVYILPYAFFSTYSLPFQPPPCNSYYSISNLLKDPALCYVKCTTHSSHHIGTFNITWPQGYKTFFMLNSTEHEILNADKCKNTEKFRFFSGPDQPIMLFFLLINITIVGILTFMSRKNSCSVELSMKKVL